MYLALFGIGTIAILLFGLIGVWLGKPIICIIGGAFGMTFTIVLENDGVITMGSTYSGSSYVPLNVSASPYDLIPAFLTLLDFVILIYMYSEFKKGKPKRQALSEMY